MKVVARLPSGVRYGFFEKRRRDGDVFEVPEGARLGSWMVPVEVPEAQEDDPSEPEKPKRRGRPKKSEADTQEGGE